MSYPTITVTDGPTIHFDPPLAEWQWLYSCVPRGIFEQELERLKADYRGKQLRKRDFQRLGVQIHQLVVYWTKHCGLVVPVSPAAAASGTSCAG